MFTQRNRFREGVAALLMTCPAWAAPPEVLISNKGTLGLSFAVLTVVLVVLGIMELKAMRERNSELAIDRLAAAAAQRKAKVNTDSVALLNEELQNIPDTPARPAMPPPPPPPGGAMPPPPPPPPSASMAPPPPPPPTRAVPTFSAEPEGGEPPTRIMSVPPPPPPPAAPVMKEESLGNTSGSWADMLQKVRANEGDARPKSSAQDSKGSTGSGAWEALLKKASSGASSGEGASPFAKASGDLPTPPPLKEDDTINPDPSKKPGRTISLDFGSGGNPFQKSE